MAECTFKSDAELEELLDNLRQCPKIERVDDKFIEIVYPDGSRKLVELEFVKAPFKEPELIPMALYDLGSRAATTGRAMQLLANLLNRE